MRFARSRRRPSGAFPRNTEIEATQTFTSENPPRALAGLLPDGHTMSLRIHHTFLKLPEPGFFVDRVHLKPEEPGGLLHVQEPLTDGFI